MNNNSFGDMLIRIKNALLAHHKSLMVPYSVFKEKLARFLAQEGYLEKVAVNQEKNQKFLQIDLKYKGRKSVVNDLRQISKPGWRHYLKVNKIGQFRRRGPGLVIVSTSKGLMSLKEAKKKNLGGELLCEIW